MEALAALAASGPDALRDGLRHLPTHYETWIAEQEKTIAGIAGAPRQATAQRLVNSARQARDRIAAGISLLCGDRHARLAFRAMNEAIARAARQREAGQDGDPSALPAPRWRPFQLAFILLNLSGLQDRLHTDREVVDLLFFPTGGGKTEAYLGLAAWTIAHRRITNGGTLGAGVAVLMRYTLRLLTLDQLSRASGVVCALELMRGEPAWKEGDSIFLVTGRLRSACGLGLPHLRTGLARQGMVGEIPQSRACGAIVGTAARHRHRSRLARGARHLFQEIALPAFRRSESRGICKSAAQTLRASSPGRGLCQF